MRFGYKTFATLTQFWLTGLLIGLSTGFIHIASVQAQRISYERPPVDYLNSPVADIVCRLEKRIADGEVELEYDSEHGYLPSLLRELNVPIESQTLVFSKTSLQIRRISPRRPRAIYFNDEVYVGWCQNGDVVELATTDPKQGAIFYTLSQALDEPVQFVRDRGQCLTCHANSRTQDVPGYLVRSVFANAAGRPAMGSRTYTSDHSSPFSERWGGWYVTGTHGGMKHMGNQTCRGRDTDFDLREGANVIELKDLVNTKPYLSAHSDIVALMVMEHQTQMHNAIAVANYETRLAVFQSEEMNQILEKPDAGLSDSAKRRIESVAENLVYHLLMGDDFQFTSPVKGTSGYAEVFEEMGKLDSQGRSLRKLNCQTRLFEYPCSYLIHSKAFQALPDLVRRKTLEKLARQLAMEPERSEFLHLTSEIRKQIVEVLLGTHPEFREIYELQQQNQDAKKISK